MRASHQRIDSAAANVANSSTPGFKRHLRSVEQTPPSFDAALAQLRVDLSAGSLNETGRPLDLAIDGTGFFQLRAGERLIYSRQGAFSLDASGRVATPQGYVLQQAGGGDLILENAAVSVAADGTILDEDRPIGRIAVFQAETDADVSAIDGSVFAIADDVVSEVEAPMLRQGALEASNVSVGDEMTAMMVALRGGETGAKLVQVYDDLMGKAIGTFGQVSR